MKDKIAKENKWNDLNAIDCAHIPVYFPKELEKCDQFKGWAVWMLSEEARFDDECDDYAGWKMTIPVDWIKLLSAQVAPGKEYFN